MKQDDTIVTLTPYELMGSVVCGALRQVEALKDGRRDRHGFTAKQNPLMIHIMGASGEQAVAKYLGVFWSPSVNTFRTKGDVGALEVRTRAEDGYDLLIRPDDADEKVFVLVIGTYLTFDVKGWVVARQAKQPEYSKTHGGRPAAFFMPARDLRAPIILKRKLLRIALGDIATVEWK